MCYHSSHHSRALAINIIHFPSILRNVVNNVNYGNFENNSRVKSEIRVIVSIYQYNISVFVSYNVFFFIFGKVTYPGSFNIKNIHEVQVVQNVF